MSVRALLTGWFSFLEGEATAGDVLALRRVEEVMRERRVPYDVVWSPGFRPGALSFRDVEPGRYGLLLFVCGPLHGPQVAGLHEEYAHCRRLAVGVSVIDPGDPAVRGFHEVIARDGPDVAPLADLSAGTRPPRTLPPVVGVVLTGGQQEYGGRRRHEGTAERVTGWLARQDCARLPLETRLDDRDWRLCRTPEQWDAVLSRLDLVVTDRLHGLVLALRSGVPALAVDPVAGGAKVSAQAQAMRWPALVHAEQMDDATLAYWWEWVRTEGPARAAAHAASPPPDLVAAALRSTLFA
ncbi:polysaccharide pyruvyl transferase family protein [Streptomyces sulphureus]|uniref:polysaccharide pyruvyl transferase family protein n=1 Tax=Streptomyces sulphureus TaxID=47758 RepID=UPI000365AD00|nr:polysaccharide pyruvyl transferase family protein [Streptomyces sulphureus]